MCLDRKYLDSVSIIIVFLKYGILSVMILALSGSSFTYAQQATTSDMKPVENQTSNAQRNPSGGTTKGNTVVAPIMPTISALIMLDMGWDKAILSWNTTAVFDSIIFRFAPTGSLITRTVGISGNPNPERYYLTGLQSQTSYDIEVSTISGGFQSGWSAPLTVTTFNEPGPRLGGIGNSTGLMINPNPAAATTTISFIATTGQPQVVSIVSSTGRVVYSRTIVPTTDKVLLNLDVSSYLPGIYMVRINSNTSVSVDRLIKL